MSTLQSFLQICRPRRGWADFIIWTVFIITMLFAFLLVVSEEARLAELKPRERAGAVIPPDEIKAVIVRDKAANQVKLTMLVEHNRRFKQALRDLLADDVTPIFFSVSVLPGHVARFNPAALVFAQDAKTWQPDPKDLASTIMPLDPTRDFGGVIESGEVRQAFILLPAWFSAEAPIHVDYTEEFSRR